MGVEADFGAMLALGTLALGLALVGAAPGPGPIDYPNPVPMAPEAPAVEPRVPPAPSGAGAVSGRAPRRGGPHYRLPQTAVPYKYEISLTTNLPNDDFSGEVKIYLHAVRSTSQLTLHMNHAVLKLVGKPEVFQEGAIEVISTEKDEELEMLILYLEKPIEPEKNMVALTIKYTGTLRTDMYGFYRSTYETSTGEERVLAATQFEPTHARSAFPCWDEPNYKAVFAISITHPPNVTALSNTKVDTSKPDASLNMIKTTFEKSPLMSSYLVAFVVSDFKNVGDATKMFNVWTRPEQTEQGKYGYEVGPKTLESLNSFTDINYDTMMKKLDLVAIPDFSAGAMENWGLITFRETGLLFTEGESTEASRQSIALVIAHEQAHMWFGDLVSPEWWSYTWLNEGFARYFQYVAMDEVNKDWRLMDSFVTSTIQAALSVDSLETSHAMTSEVWTPSEIQGVFDTISYDKGASILHMTRNFLGADKFQAGIREYLKTMSYNAASPKNLFDAFQKQGANATLPENVTVADVLETWTAKPGYPLLTVKKMPGNKVAISQSRFLLSTPSVSSGSSEGSRWWVPLSFTSEADPKFDSAPSKWLDPAADEIEVDVGEGWTIFNLQQKGFYRVNYDTDQWVKITEFLCGPNFTTIHLLNRAQLLDDAMTLARAEQLEYPFAMNLSRYLTNETDAIPWTAALRQMSFLRSMLSGHKAEKDLNEYLLKLLQNVYVSVNFAEKPEDPHLTKIFRSSVLGLACSLGHEDCVNNTRDAFNELRDNGKTVNPGVRSTVYCTALRVGEKKDWDFLWKRYQDTGTTAGEKALILSALGCTNNTDVLNNYLSMTLDSSSGIRAQDAQTVFSSVLGGNPENVQIAFEFFKKNFKKMTEMYGGWSSIQRVIEGIANKMDTEEKVEMLETFLRENRADLGVAEASANRALELSKTNLAWRKKKIPELASWLSSASRASLNMALVMVVVTLLFSRFK